MSIRRVDMTRRVNVADVNVLVTHPNVRKIWKIPWDYILFEFYDPIFDLLDKPGVSPLEYSTLTRDLRPKLSELVKEERTLLSPLYAGRPLQWQGNQFGLPLKSVLYRVLDKKKIKWPWFGFSTDWETETSIRICGTIKTGAPEAQKYLNDAFSEWARWAKSVGVAISSGDILHENLEFSVSCQLSECCGDACMALYLLLTQVQDRTSLAAVGFFRPDEVSIRFLEVGGAGMLAWHEGRAGTS
jgi:hypothetical protein